MRKVIRMSELPTEQRIRLELQLERNHPSKTRRKLTKKIQSKSKMAAIANSYYKLAFNGDEYKDYLKNKLN